MIAKTGDGMIRGASSLTTALAWRDQTVQDQTLQALRLHIVRNLGGTGSREYRTVTFGTLTEAGEFIGQLPDGAEPTHVLVFLELSP